MFRGLGATLAPGAVPAGPRPQPRRLRGDPSAHPGAAPTRMVATGQLPKFADDAYHLERDDLWAIPTAEVPLTSMASDEILDEAELPMRLMAYTPVLPPRGRLGRPRHPGPAAGARVRQGRAARLRHPRAGARRATTRSWAGPRRSSRDLGLAYRVLDLCTGDLGQSHRRAPSTSRCTPRASISGWRCPRCRGSATTRPGGRNIRYRPDRRARAPRSCHTLNGSALAVPRVWAAVVETHRQPDGSVALPEVLHPYLGGATRLGPPA